jgi:thiol-disulfide isomerase/thioredoxin
MISYRSILPLSLILFSLWTISCQKQEKPLQEGLWQGYFQRADSIEIPFRLQVTYPDAKSEMASIALYTEDETLPAQLVEITADSVFATLAYFDTELRFKLESSTRISGFWVDNSREGMTLPFYAVAGVVESPVSELSGKFAVTFRPGAPNAYPAVALIEQDDAGLKATFRTPSGDYRFLRGYLKDGQLVLHRFDGQVIYLLTADVKGDSLINGKHYSGPTYLAEWQGILDSNAQMSDPYERTKVINSTPVELKVLNIDGDTILLDKAVFQDKITLLTIMGTWCPNCLDESRFIDQYLKENPGFPIQVFGLCFERPSSWDHVQRILRKYTAALKLPFPLYYVGPPDADFANAVFPMLDGIKAWPTMVVLDRQGQISKVHTGFDGPAAGEAYLEHIKAFDQLMRALAE